jgi:histone deacetylase 1/2
MASSSIVNPWVGITVTEKLSRTNHAMWRAQILTAVRGFRLEGHLTGAIPAPAAEVDGKDATGKDIKTPNPEYAEWYARDQQVLSFVLGSLAREILSQVAAKKMTTALWSAIEDMFSSQNRARAVNTRLALATTRKGNMTIAEYVGKMQALGDQMVAAGQPLEEEELVEYILTGLDEDFNPIVSALIARKEKATVSEAYQQLLAFENHMDLLGIGHSGSSANSANRGGRGNGGGRGYNQGGRGGGGRGYNAGGRGRGNDNFTSNVNNNHRQGNSGGGRRGNKGSNSNSKLVCQVCLKSGHTADQCWHRFEENYVPEVKNASAAMNSYNIDSNWYTDTGATDHITGELEKLAIWDKYNGVDQIHTASGAGMHIRHIGQYIIHTPNCDLHLQNILHVPSTKKNLVSVHRLASDNNVFLEFHPDFFLIKDRDTRSTLLKGPCRKGLYPFPSTSSSKQACGVNKVPISRWHSRLGHPAFPIVERVLKSHELPFLSESNKLSVCGACQQAKSHQLPYPISTSVSTKPLELVFSDVWGPAIDSVGKYKYYVNFIDDFSKHTWIYFMKYKSEVFQKFRDFQNQVERLFDGKIIAVQSDWGGEYEKLNSFFTKIGITHLVSCPHAHQQNGAAERKHRHIVEVGLSLLAHAHMP